MNRSGSALHQYVILADESANWRIAGLRQLERLFLAVHEFAGSADPSTNIEVVLLWRPDIEPGRQWRPNNAPAKRLRVTEAIESVQSGAHILSTRMVLGRRSLAEFAVPTERAAWEKAPSWPQLFERLEASSRAPGPGFCLLSDPGDVKSCEREFLRRTGKSQDGIVSKLLNRPISRAVTRQLLKYPVAPTSWTLAIFVLPLIAFVLLGRGDYIGFVSGAAIFQLFSMLDGCDGEIARAKYLESVWGARIDHLCDLAANVLFLLGLGLGLSRHQGSAQTQSAYLVEAILCSAIVVTNELLLRFSRQHSPSASAALTETLYPRHRSMIQHSGLVFFGEKVVSWIFQLTKRDVSILVFFFLAIANLPQWILHLWLAVASLSLALAGIAAVRGRAHRAAVVPP